MKNKAIDLHNILFEQLERLNDLEDEEMKGDKLLREIQRSEAMNKVAVQLISNGRLVLDAIKMQAETHGKVDLPEMLVSKPTPSLPSPMGVKPKNA